MTCRCGYDGTGVHQCHVGREVRRCPNPGVDRLVAYPAMLAGVQMKFGAVNGCYCVQHWAEFAAGLEPSDLSETT